MEYVFLFAFILLFAQLFLILHYRMQSFMASKRYKLVYITQSLYMSGGVERVLTLKANYFAEHFGYDITIVTTDGKDKPAFFPISDKVKVVNLDINFEDMWHHPLYRKIMLYFPKQRRFKNVLSAELNRLKPDFTISLLRREINFLTDIKDGSKKIGELHINRAHYRTFEGKDANALKYLFSKFWMNSLLSKLRRLDRLVVLTEKDREAWVELNNVIAIPNPLSISPVEKSDLSKKRVIAIGRYCYEKGYDHLLKAWAIIQDKCPEWQLAIYADGDHTVYERMRDELHIDSDRCFLNGRTSDVISEFVNSSIAVCSSRFEGFGMGIIEAMSCGLPVVAFDCPWGPRSIIMNGKDGMLVENGNVEKLAEAIIHLAQSPDSLSQMGQTARVNVRRFDIDTIAEKWKRLFDDLS